MRVLVFILLGIVTFETYYIFKNIKNTKFGTFDRSAINKEMTPAQVEEVKKSVETSLGKEVVIQKVETIGVPNYFRIISSRQSLWLDDRNGLLCMGQLIDMSSKINLNTGSEIAIINGFLHPSRSVGQKMEEEKLMPMQQHLLKKDVKPESPAK